MIIFFSRVPASLEILDLTLNRRFNGQRPADPKVLLLDEPAAGLSPAERSSLLKIIKELPRTITLLMIEHDMDIILEVSDWISVLHDGQKLTDGQPESIAADSRVREVYLGYANA